MRMRKYPDVLVARFQIARSFRRETDGLPRLPT